jgi:hypothetical protein
MWDEDDRHGRLRLLEAAGMAHASDAVLDVAELAQEFDVAEATIRMDLGQLEALGLVLSGLDEGLPPILLTAGRQFLARRGGVEQEVLGFLPRVIDDLNARKALLVAGRILVDEFRAAFVDGDPVDHARALVPPAFSAAVDERLALDLFAASVALMARLSDGAPAGCVAEEMIAVGLIEEARVWLELRREEGRLDEHEERARRRGTPRPVRALRGRRCPQHVRDGGPRGRGTGWPRPTEPTAGSRRPARGVVVRRVRRDIAYRVPDRPITGPAGGLNDERRASPDRALGPSVRASTPPGCRSRADLRFRRRHQVEIPADSGGASRRSRPRA